MSCRFYHALSQLSCLVPEWFAVTQGEKVRSLEITTAVSEPTWASTCDDLGSDIAGLFTSKIKGLLRCGFFSKKKNFFRISLSLWICFSSLEVVNFILYFFFSPHLWFSFCKLWSEAGTTRIPPWRDQQNMRGLNGPLVWTRKYVGYLSSCSVLFGIFDFLESLSSSFFSFISFSVPFSFFSFYSLSVVSVLLWNALVQPSCWDSAWDASYGFLKCVIPTSRLPLKNGYLKNMVLQI